MQMPTTTISLFLNGRYQYAVEGPVALVIQPTIERWQGDWAPGGLDDSWWFSEGRVRRRQACSVIADGLTLRGVRPGSTIIIESEHYECSDGGDVKLSFQYPGTYEITVTCWPYLDGKYTVENLPPTE